MGKRNPLPPGTTRIDGSDGSITFDGRYVTVRHKWHASVGAGEGRYPLGSISGVNVKSGILLASVTLVIPGAEPWKGKGDPLTVNGFQKHEAVAFRDLVVKAREFVDAAPVPVPARITPDDVSEAGSVAGADRLVEQLRQLAALHSQGALTDEEFAAAKARLLGTEPRDDPPRRR